MRTQFHYLLPAWLVCASISQAASTYLETFPNSNSENLSHTSIGWTAVYGASATDGSGNSMNNVNGGFVISSISNGYGAKTTFNNTYGLAYTTEFLGVNNLTTADITNISFHARNSSATDRYRIVLAIDVGGITEWFVSNQYFTTSPGIWADGAQLQQMAFTTTATAWRTMTSTTTALSISDNTLGAALPRLNRHSDLYVTRGFASTSSWRNAMN